MSPGASSIEARHPDEKEGDMRALTDGRRIGLALVCATAALGVGGCATDTNGRNGGESAYANPRPGQLGHRAHEEWQGAYPSLESQRSFKVTGHIAPPA